MFTESLGCKMESLELEHKLTLYHKFTGVNIMIIIFKLF